MRRDASVPRYLRRLSKVKREDRIDSHYWQSYLTKMKRTGDGDGWANVDKPTFVYVPLSFWRNHQIFL